MPASPYEILLLMAAAAVIGWTVGRVSRTIEVLAKSRSDRSH